MAVTDGRDEVVPYRDPDAVREGNALFATWLVYVAGLVRRGDMGPAAYGSLMMMRDDGTTLMRVFRPGAGLN